MPQKKEREKNSFVGGGERDIIKRKREFRELQNKERERERDREALVVTKQKNKDTKKPSYKYKELESRKEGGRGNQKLRRAPRRLGPELEQRLGLRVQVGRQLLGLLSRHARAGAQVAPDVELVEGPREGVPAEVGRGGGGERAPGEAGGADLVCWSLVRGGERERRGGVRLRGEMGSKKKKKNDGIRSSFFVSSLLSSFSVSLSSSSSSSSCSLITHRVRICFSIECLAARPAP